MKILRILVFLLILNSLILAGFLVSNLTGSVVNNSKIEHANITKIVDGDTIDTSFGRVRLLGINTPEKNRAGYQEATNYLKQLENKTVNLEKIGENKDQYGRLLRYVFYGDLFINKEILALGLAHFYSYEEDKYTDELRETEEKARSLGLGIWEKSKEKCSSCIFLVKLNEIDPGEYVILGNNCSFSCNLQGWTVNDDSSSHEKKLNFVIQANSQYRIDYNGSIWNDAGDSLYLRDELGGLVIFYRY